MGALAYDERYTRDDYRHWEGDWELIEGNAYAMAPSPMFSHQNLVVKISRVMDEALDGCDRCMVAIEMDWDVSEDTVLKPDVMVVCDQVGERVVKAPLIVFEVISKSSVKRDEILKFELYKDEGVKYYALVYPDMKKAKLYLLKDDSYQKVGDFINEQYEFKLEACNLGFDFSRIWRK
ncbi:MAG: Uma2 family endonuclease [Campylobacterales bacterium]